MKCLILLWTAQSPMSSLNPLWLHQSSFKKTLVREQCHNHDGIILAITFFADIQVSLDRSSYTITEGQSVTICAVIGSGIIDTAVTLSLSTTQGTAQGQC